MQQCVTGEKGRGWGGGREAVMGYPMYCVGVLSSRGEVALIFV